MQIYAYFYYILCIRPKAVPGRSARFEYVPRLYSG